MGYNIISKCGNYSLIFQNPFFYMDSLFILTIQWNKGWWYLMTNSLVYFGEFPNPTRKFKGRQQRVSMFWKDSLKLQLIILDK
jgi:hypothetical protein